MPLPTYCCIASVAFGSLLAQTPKTGGVAGVVIENKSGDGVSKAIVIVRRDQEPGIGASTDATGKFGLRDLEPETYT